MKQFIHLPKLKPGDQVAIISPSSGLAAVYPWVINLGIERLENEFQLRTREYPTTRLVDASLEDRARDIMAAFTDEQNKAVFSTIGGSDQIKLLKLLDPTVLKANPKPFFGYSDNTNLHNYLWNLGIPSYYGASIMTQFAMQGSMDAMTTQSIKAALFEQNPVTIQPAEEFTDIGLNWSEPANLTKRRVYESNDKWFWDGTADAKGTLWGGCVETLMVQFATGIYLPSAEDLEETVLFIETAEDIPEHWIIEYLLIGMGERGWFEKFQAVFVGRPKAWEYNKPNEPDFKLKYRTDQRETVLKTIRSYNSTIPVIQNMDFGHTDPQTVLPMGRLATIDSATKTITLDY